MSMQIYVPYHMTQILMTMSSILFIVILTMHIGSDINANFSKKKKTDTRRTESVVEGHVTLAV